MYYLRIFKKINIVIIRKLRGKNYIDSKMYRLIILLKVIKKILKSILAKRIINIAKKNYLLLIEKISIKRE